MSRHAELVVEHIPRLRRYARALLRNPDRAEDLVQETLTRALGRMHFWRVGSDLRAWLFSIMHNQFANDCRSAGRRPAMIGLDEPGVDPPSPASADSGAGLDDIETAVMQLPPEQRAALLLVSLEGLSYADTARVLRVKPGTVMSRLHRAREQLRHSLDYHPRGHRAGQAADTHALRRVK